MENYLRIQLFGGEGGGAKRFYRACAVMREREVSPRLFGGRYNHVCGKKNYDVTKKRTFNPELFIGDLWDKISRLEIAVYNFFGEPQRENMCSWSMCLSAVCELFWYFY